MFILHVMFILQKPAVAKEPAKEPPKPSKVSLFSGSDDEDDLFSVKKSPAKTKATTVNPPAEVFHPVLICM